MKRIVLLCMAVVSTSLMLSCKKPSDEQNSVKVSIAFDDADKNQKIYIHSGSEAAVYWTNQSRIGLMNTSNINYTLIYTGNTNNVANFQIENGSNIAPGDYIGFYPANATLGNKSITFEIPSVYTIDPQAGKDQYIINNLFMYTKTKYTHGSKDTAFFSPAMTLLEIPFKTDSDSYYIKNIKITAVGPQPENGAFIKKGTLSISQTPPSLTVNSSGNTLDYTISGQGLSIGTTPDTIKLLIWSKTVSGLQYYKISVNNGIVEKKIIRTTAFLNSKYYKLPPFVIPDSIVKGPAINIGDFHEGGYVFHIFKPGENGYVPDEIHGYVCAPTVLSNKKWDNSKNFTSVNTRTAFGTGINNTQLIKSVLGNKAEAAYACDTCTQSGKTDWFLPSRDELDSMRSKLFAKGIVNFTNDFYFSSSQESQDKAYYIVFNLYIPYTSGFEKKNKGLYVCPVRIF